MSNGKSFRLNSGTVLTAAHDNGAHVTISIGREIAHLTLDELAEVMRELEELGIHIDAKRRAEVRALRVDVPPAKVPQVVQKTTIADKGLPHPGSILEAFSKSVDDEDGPAYRED